jgi:hypothetical protein
MSKIIMKQGQTKKLKAWVKRQKAPFTMADAAVDALKLSADKMTPAIMTRLGMALRHLGCTRLEDRLAADPSRRRLYVPPGNCDDPIFWRALLWQIGCRYLRPQENSCPE